MFACRFRVSACGLVWPDPPAHQLGREGIRLLVLCKRDTSAGQGVSVCSLSTELETS